MMRYRQCIILKGDTVWCRNTAIALLADFADDRVSWIADVAAENVFSLKPNQAQALLGKEMDVIVFDGCDQFNPDAFGAVAGTVRAGGVLVLLLSADEPQLLWLRRLNQIILQSPVIQIIQAGDPLPTLTVPDREIDKFDIVKPCYTLDQTQAVSAILKVVHGHRRRPLVLSSDRGRGKSAALGIAAAQLIEEGRQSIIVTAPSLATVATVFEYASRCLPDADISRGWIQKGDCFIKFIAPDILAYSDEKADLVLVDEAAAISAPLLEKILDKFSRLVFATTLHGYEGTGRGFAVRFQQVLDKKTPDWRHYRMEIPIRWLANDSLEAFTFKALLLDASPIDDGAIINATVETCQFEQIDREHLLMDETSLSQLFGLMVLAHYRTKPSDLKMMLDDPNISVWAMRYQGHIVATAWMVKEGNLSPDLAAGIHGGQRRLAGHLLPQSLVAHAGIIEFAALSYQRIIRVAVHPAIQQRGIGSALIQRLCKESKKSGADIIGSSYGATVELLRFWSQAGFSPARLGIKKGDSSGSHSVMMLNDLTKNGESLCRLASSRFQQQWSYLLQRDLSALDPDIVIAIYRLLAEVKPDLSKYDKQDIAAFVEKQRGFEFSQYPIWLLVTARIRSTVINNLTIQQQHLLVMVVLQNRNWSDVSACLGLSGKRQALQVLRESIKIITTSVNNT